MIPERSVPAARSRPHQSYARQRFPTSVVSKSPQTPYACAHLRWPVGPPDGDSWAEARRPRPARAILRWPRGRRKDPRTLTGGPPGLELRFHRLPANTPATRSVWSNSGPNADLPVRVRRHRTDRPRRSHPGRGVRRDRTRRRGPRVSTEFVRCDRTRPTKASAHAPLDCAGVPIPSRGPARACPHPGRRRGQHFGLGEPERHGSRDLQRDRRPCTRRARGPRSTSRSSWPRRCSKPSSRPTNAAA